MVLEDPWPLSFQIWLLLHFLTFLLLGLQPHTFMDVCFYAFAHFLKSDLLGPCLSWTHSLQATGTGFSWGALCRILNPGVRWGRGQAQQKWPCSSGPVHMHDERPGQGLPK